MIEEQIDAKPLTTNEKAQAKALELEKALKVYKVHPLIFKEPSGEEIVGFIKEPERLTKIRMLDKSMIGSISAAAECYDIILIKEASDPRMYSEAPEHDAIYIGAVMAAYDLIKYKTNTFKKN